MSRTNLVSNSPPIVILDLFYSNIDVMLCSDITQDGIYLLCKMLSYLLCIYWFIFLILFRDKFVKRCYVRLMFQKEIISLHFIDVGYPRSINNKN